MLSSNTSAVSGDANYIEDVFSTYLTSGNSSTQNVVNGIDLSTKGGMVWAKARSNAVNNSLFDTARGATKRLISNATTAEQTYSDSLTSFNTNGFSLGADATSNAVNASGVTYASWTFRKQPKFFDVVTYTGNGTAGRTISHSLGATPGFLIVKGVSGTNTSWRCWHRTQTDKYLTLNTTGAAQTDGGVLFGNGSVSVAPTSTNFTVSSDGDVNANGATYVAYLFAHDAGGFGLTGTDNVISCGSTTNGSTVNLGYEPQWVLMKNTAVSQDWFVWDTMRGMALTYSEFLYPNLSSAAVAGATAYVIPTATGFTLQNLSPSNTYIYIAIRRGPMKVPTDATKVFYPSAISNAVDTKNTIGFPTDLVIDKIRGSGTEKMRFFDRLRGLRSPGLSNTVPELVPSSTAAEAANGSENPVVDNTAFYTPSGLTSAYGNIIFWNFQRAPSFFDEVCFTGTSNAYLDRLNHNLGVAPELIIVKKRSAVNDWYVYSSSSNGGTNPQNYYLYLDGTNALVTGTNTWGNVTPNSSTFAFYADNGATYVSYLFATCPGVSKVGSYTGNGSSQTINCGFAAGARFILIKRTDSTGDWYVWDTARGIVSGNDPHLSLNTTSAEVTTDDTIDTDSTGFVVNQLSATNVNVSSATYIYLAIA